MIQRFLSGLNLEPFENVLDLLSLSPDRLVPALVLLGGLVLLNDLVRTALMTEYTRSVPVHVVINVLTLLPAAVIGLVLLWAGYRHPERAWINLLFAAVLYGVWYVGGSLTWLSRRDTEGADLGWMCMGMFITVPCGLAAVLLF